MVLNGWRVGELHWGGYATKARVKADWLVTLPDGSRSAPWRSARRANRDALRDGAGEAWPHAGSRRVLVTGAAGGVGSVAVAILAKLGFTVVAATGRPQEADYLKALGATTIMDRKELTERRTVRCSRSASRASWTRCRA